MLTKSQPVSSICLDAEIQIPLRPGCTVILNLTPPCFLNSRLVGFFSLPILRATFWAGGKCSIQMIHIIVKHHSNAEHCKHRKKSCARTLQLKLWLQNRQSGENKDDQSRKNKNNSSNNRNRPYSYSRYWTGTSLQWRLMRGNLFKCK